jgi:nitrogen fixation NifU-like protein
MDIRYAGLVQDHYENPRNVGSLAPGPGVATGMAGSPKSGVVRFQLRVEDGVVTDARFKAHGCGYTIAAASYATDWIKGRPVTEAAGLRHDLLAQALEMPALKLSSALLVEDALKAALDELDLRPGTPAAGRRRQAP